MQVLPSCHGHNFIFPFFFHHPISSSELKSVEPVGSGANIIDRGNRNGHRVQVSRRSSNDQTDYNKIAKNGECDNMINHMIYASNAHFSSVQTDIIYK